jgi:hypothetical protein
MADGEDEALSSYLDRSAELDRRALALLIAPRGRFVLQRPSQRS